MLVWLSRGPVAKLQRMSVRAINNVVGFNDVLEEVLRSKTWLVRPSANGTPLGSFAALMVAPIPYGLGVNSTERVRPFFDYPKRTRRYDLYLELLTAVKRRPGAPSKKLADSDIFQPFHTPSRSSTSLDQILPRLERDHPLSLADVIAHRHSPQEAARNVGLLRRSTTKFKFGICSIAGIARLTARAQGKLLCAVFDAVGEDARCGLLARRMEVRLGPGLASKWREPARLRLARTPNDIPPRASAGRPNVPRLSDISTCETDLAS